MLQALSQNFYVCGSTLTDDLKAKHIIINKIEDYPLLIGSKYVQSFNCGLCHKSCPVYFKPHNEENLAEIYAC